MSNITEVQAPSDRMYDTALTMVSTFEGATVREQKPQDNKFVVSQIDEQQKNSLCELGCTLS